MTCLAPFNVVWLPEKRATVTSPEAFCKVQEYSTRSARDGRCLLSRRPHVLGHTEKKKLALTKDQYVGTWRVPLEVSVGKKATWGHCNKL